MVNQSFPLSAVVMDSGTPSVPNAVIVPSGVIRPIERAPVLVNQVAPSRPAVGWRALLPSAF